MPKYAKPILQLSSLLTLTEIMKAVTVQQHNKTWQTKFSWVCFWEKLGNPTEKNFRKWVFSRSWNEHQITLPAVFSCWCNTERTTAHWDLLIPECCSLIDTNIWIVNPSGCERNEERTVLKVDVTKLGRYLDWTHLFPLKGTGVCFLWYFGTNFQPEYI